MKLFYTKWVKGECRHFCFCCKYKHQCDIKSATLQVIKISYEQGYKDGYRQAIIDMKERITK